MDKQKAFLLNEATDNMNTILEDIYGKLSGRPFSEDALADVLCQHIQGQSREQLLANIRLLDKGIETGQEAFERLYNLPQESLDDEIEKQLDQYLKSFDEAEKRQYLLLLCQVLYQDSGFKINSNLSIYMANMPTEAMKNEVCLLLKEKGKEIVGDTTSLLSGAADRLRKSEGTLGQSEFKEGEKELIMASAVYASMQKSELKIIGAEQVGRQIGIQKSFLQRFGETLHDKVIPVMLRVLAIAAVAVAVYCLIEFLVYSEALAFATTYISQNHLWKIALPAAFSVAAVGCSWFSENLLSDPIIYRIQSEADDARSRLQRHFDQTEIQADRFAESFIPEYIEVEEDSYSDYIVDDSGIEEIPDIII